ncbi:unnamed protein product, partial [Symbiodinium sp. KB8]
MRADRFVYQNAKNVTLEGLQRHFADSFKISGNPEAEGQHGWTLHPVISKGDWKYKREWLQQVRHYGNLAGCGEFLATITRVNIQICSIAYETWDERLHHLHGDFQMWCKEHQFRPSLLDGLSLIKLGVDAVSLDYPLGPGKGWANRVLIAYLADRLSALSESVPELRLAAVNTWSITAFANLLDNCPIWLTDDQ